MKFSLKKGFTLVELMVVISIIAVLSSITLVAVTSTRQTARDGYRLAQIRQIKTALELYYNTYGYYPYDEVGQGYDLTDFKIPYYWKEMISDLNDDNFIKATFAMNTDQPIFKSAFSPLVKTALASVGGGEGAVYYACSLQDPLYRTADDYKISYAYLPEQVATYKPKSYKIRVKFEKTNNLALSNSITGAFWGNSATGDTACDTSLGYYCTSETK